MTPKSPSLTAYDFLGYIVPGLGFLALIDIAFLSQSDNIILSCNAIFTRYSDIKITGVIPLVLLSYVVGHLVSFISSISLEKHLVWLHDTPTNTLTGHGENHGYFHTGGSSPKLSFLLRFFTFILILPVSLSDVIFTKILKLADNYFRPLDSFTISAIDSAFTHLAERVEADTDEWNKSSDIHNLILHCALESAPAHVASLRNYVVLYGLMRCVTLMSVVITWALIIYLNGSYGYKVVLSYSLASLFITWCSYASYLKFLHRYHKEGLFALVAAYANRKTTE